MKKYNNFKNVGHLALLFKAMEQMTDKEILDMGEQINWRAPDVYLTIFTDPYYKNRKEGTHSFIWPVQTLLRAGSPRIKEIFLTKKLFPSYADQVYIPFIDKERDTYSSRDDFSLAMTEALARLDIQSLEKIKSLGTPEDLKNIFLWRLENSGIWNFGNYDVCEGIFDPIKASQCIDFIVQGQLDHEKDLFKLYKYFGTKKQKKIQFRKDMVGALLNDAIQQKNEILVEFFIEQGATINALTLDLAIHSQSIPQINRILGILREAVGEDKNKDKKTVSNFRFIQNITSNKNNNRFDSEMDVLKVLEKETFKNIENIKNNYLYTLTKTSEDEQQIEELKKSSSLLKKMVYFLLEDNLAFDSFPGVDKSKLVESVSYFMGLEKDDIQNKQWIDCLRFHEVQVTVGELTSLIQSENAYLLKERLRDTQNQYKDQNGLDFIFKEITKSLNDFIQPQEIKDEKILFLAGIWEDLSQLKPHSKASIFAQKIGMSPDQATYFLMQIQKIKSPSTQTSNKVRI